MRLNRSPTGALRGGDHLDGRLLLPLGNGHRLHGDAIRRSGGRQPNLALSFLLASGLYNDGDLAPLPDLQDLLGGEIQCFCPNGRRGFFCPRQGRTAGLKAVRHCRPLGQKNRMAGIKACRPCRALGQKHGGQREARWLTDREQELAGG